jgi:tight adherence protein C
MTSNSISIDLLIFCGVFAITLLAERSFGRYLALRRRLGQDRTEVNVARGSVLKRSTISNRFLLWVQAATATGNEQETSKLQRKLALAGFEHPAAPVWYVICRFSLAIGLPISLIIGSNLTGRPLTGLSAVVAPLLLSGIGLLAPHYAVTHRANARRAEMENEFPDALDLLVVCVEAGLGLEAAFVRVAQEVAESHPRICSEFGILANELAAGRTRADALRALADRVDVTNVTSFVALLIQSDSLGVSIAQSLRTYSSEMRESRYQKAEEKAMRIPVLMTMPIVACFMPVIIVALLLPPAIDVVRVLLPTMAGQGGHAAHAPAALPKSTP